MAQPKPLMPKQQRFVEEYLVDLSAARAAVRAGYSEKTAEQIGYQLLQKTSISLAVQEAFETRSERTEITADMVVQGLLAEARDHDEGSSHSARVAAWAHLGKHLGLFIERHEVAGKADFTFVIGKGYVDSPEQLTGPSSPWGVSLSQDQGR